MRQSAFTSSVAEPVLNPVPDSIQDLIQCSCLNAIRSTLSDAVAASSRKSVYFDLDFDVDFAAQRLELFDVLGRDAPVVQFYSLTQRSQLTGAPTSGC